MIVQFCGNDPQQILNSAKVLEPYCDAVDINLGCPQDIARKGKYGAFLQDEWDLIYDISKYHVHFVPGITLTPTHSLSTAVNTLHENLAIPVTAKFRVFQSIEKTVEYAKMLERAGAQILTCHGRIREQRGHNTVRPSYHCTICPLRNLSFCHRDSPIGTRSERSRKLSPYLFSPMETFFTTQTSIVASKQRAQMRLCLLKETSITLRCSLRTDQDSPSTTLGFTSLMLT